MFPTTLTGEVLEAAIREQAKNQPDKVYCAPGSVEQGTCLYVHWLPDASGVKPQAQPGCIVGSALMHLGYPAEWISVPGGAWRVLDELKGHGVQVEVEERIVDWVSAVQTRQDGPNGADSREPWGQAVEGADQAQLKRLRQELKNLEEEAQGLRVQVYSLQDEKYALQKEVTRLKGDQPLVADHDLERLLAEEEEI